jgi:hypothetical protein
MRFCTLVRLPSPAPDKRAASVTPTSPSPPAEPQDPDPNPNPNPYPNPNSYPPADPQDPNPAVKKDTERFLWNYLAFATAGINASTAMSQWGEGSLARCVPQNASAACPPGSMCAGARVDVGGVCIPTTALFMPSYSLSLKCDGCNGTQSGWTVNDTEGSAWCVWACCARSVNHPHPVLSQSSFPCC